MFVVCCWNRWQINSVILKCWLKLLCETAQRRPKLWLHKFILHYDTALAHDVFRVFEFMAKKSITEMNHPPYSPDLAACKILVFPELKKFPEVRKICWNSWHPIQHNVSARYSRKLFSILCPAVTPSPHEVNIFARRVFEGVSSCQCTDKQICFRWTIPGIKLLYHVNAFMFMHKNNFTGAFSVDACEDYSCFGEVHFFVSDV